MVVISKVYTRTGDGGTTRLSDLSETPKTDPRVEAYGDVDEANCAIGVALAAGPPDDVAEVLRFLQNELFDLGADLSTPLVADPEHPPLRVVPACVDRLERWCDVFGEGLPVLRSFVLPGGTPVAAQLHVARTVVRRAERRAWQAVERYGTAVAAEGRPGGVNEVALRYLNRLSDLLFVLARRVNGAAGEVLWVPGSDRAGAGG
ncbi:cob(I)yrinic acid a,c-diamide adenosyltransferase [Auraticoccus sp. F435]|uniref:Corrinoid adenosyltransferase n=1 Tax=Auraticoccus cholistanensis TaxID=2656650 RepID=A0A6A9V0V9_9ACTN|nr:cob(I)yrinic acid a,c-diamide adenosyltransferase [Auraticoccus cholistanensis]MVA76040.1 cob(I)yrinic acid a,c-diamide adenosyltransferase [Auraticoccus cholistanensis]